MSVIIRTDACTEQVENPALVFTPESDDFQNHAYKGISQEQAVLTNAPTGSGKTRVIHYSVAHYLKQNVSVAITTPIKALSNQKYKEFVEDFVPNSESMLIAAKKGYPTATDLADWLVSVAGLPFREAHRVTGEVVKEAEKRNISLDY